jgi:L-ascorbate peroxidase
MNSIAGGINGSIAYELERPENIGLKKSLKALNPSLLSVGVS